MKLDGKFILKATLHYFKRFFHSCLRWLKFEFFWWSSIETRVLRVFRGIWNLIFYPWFLKFFLEFLPEDSKNLILKNSYGKILPIGWKNNTKNGKPNFLYFIFFYDTENWKICSIKRQFSFIHLSWKKPKKQ